jgi:hypothetical protein
MPRVGQDPRCLEAVCTKGACGAKIRTGQILDEVVFEGDFACFSTPLVCQSTGGSAPTTDTSQFVATREGQHCLPAEASNNPCLKPVCRNKACVYEPHDEGGCPDASIAVSPCEKRGCRNGTCQAVPDPQKQGATCGEPQTAECRTTFYVCSEAGTCETTKKLAEGAECAKDPLVLGASNQLPSTFKQLLQTSVSFPTYSCNIATCKLEFCGDGIVNREEECDGDAFRPNAPSGHRCTSSCTME